MSTTTPESPHAPGEQLFSGQYLAEELEAATPDIDELLKRDPRVIAKKAEIRAARAEKNVQVADELVRQNKLLKAQIREDLERRYGIYTDPAEVATKEEDLRRGELEEIRIHLAGDESEDDLLRVFKLIDEEGKPRIESPLFKGQTQSAFGKYITSVRQYKTAVETKGVNLRNQAKANRLRQEMHNDVARAIADDLGLEFWSARRLAAKIRDAKIPGSGESRLYARQVNRELEKYGFDLGQYMDEQKHNLDEALGKPESTP